MINLAKLCCEDGLICDVFIYAFAMQMFAHGQARERAPCMYHCCMKWCGSVYHTHPRHTCNELIKVSDQSEGSLAMWAEFDTSINYSLVTARAFTVPSSMGGQETTPHVCMWQPWALHLCVWGGLCVRVCVTERASMGHGSWREWRSKRTWERVAVN